MTSKIPSPAQAPNTTIPRSEGVARFDIPAGKVPPPKRFLFSLLHWRQIEYFNVGDGPTLWFISLFERLKALGNETIEDLKADRKKSETLRFHIIDFDHKNTPLSKDTFKNRDWLGDTFFESGEVLWQISVSTGKGRIVGYFDTNDVFQILLLDIDHNAQPSKKNAYKLTNNRRGESEYDDLCAKLTRFYEKCGRENCRYKAEAKQILHSSNYTNNYTQDTKIPITLYIDENTHKKIMDKANKDDGFDFDTALELTLESI